MKKRILIALVVLLALAATASLVWANGGPVGYWRFDADANDFSGNLNHGTLVNGAATTGGSAPVPGDGASVSLDGVNDYVSVPDDASLDFGTGDFSVAAWIQIDGTKLVWHKEYGVVNKNAYFQGTPGWGLQVSTWCVDSGQIAPSFYITNQTLWGSTNVGVCRPAADAWHHIAGVRQGTTTRFYYDGDLVATKTHDSADDDVDNAQPVIIGDHIWGPNYPGLIDEVGIWNRALSAEEVAALSGSVEWLPPLALDDWTLNENATLPIKFKLKGMDSSFICTDVSPTLMVDGLLDGQTLDVRYDSEGCYYIANFRPGAPASGLTATVSVAGVTVGVSREFDIVDAGTPNGRGRSNK